MANKQLELLKSGVEAWNKWREDNLVERVNLGDANLYGANGIFRKDAEVIVTAVLESIVESLRAGEAIELRGFGSFRLRGRPARVGRNPRTGMRVDIPATRVCYFRPGKALP